MNRVLKCVMVCFIFFLILALVRSISIAQADFGFPIFVDNFEYKDSPGNHGWDREPPVYGPGLNYCPVKTVLDLQQGSQVLDVYRPASVFLIGTPYDKLSIYRDLFTPPSASDPDGEIGIDMNENPIIGFEFKAPLSSEPWDIFELDVIGTTVSGDDIIIKIVPIEPSPGDCLGGLITIENMYSAKAVVTGFGPSELEVTIAVGPSLIDDSWHAVWFDLVESVNAALEAFNGIYASDSGNWIIDTANTLKVGGRIFRIDNIIFGNNSTPEFMNNVDLFEMGPLFAQIFEPYRYLFIADYEVSEDTVKVTDLMLNPNNFLLVQDPNDPNDPVVKYWIDLGANPNLFGQDDPNMAELFAKDKFTVDLSLPIFLNPELRMTKSGPGPLAQHIIDQGSLEWHINLCYGSAIVHSFCFQTLQPLLIDPYDGMPTYLPARYSVMDVLKKYGKPYFSPQIVSLFEGALWNADVLVWSNIATFDFTPKYFEDFIVYLEVTNGVHSDFNTFPICVLNYPMENYPPVHQLPIEDLIFFVDEVGEYHINFIDPDCFIFSLSETPPSSHIPGFPVNKNFRKDIDALNWSITTMAGVSFLPSWSSYITDIIDMNDWDYGNFQCTGLLTFQPKYEKTFGMVVTCQDAKGGSAFAQLKVVCASRSDTDGDNIYDFLDNCLNIQNPDQMDTDQDDLGDACDPCPFDPNNDADGDSVCTDDGDCNDNDATIYPEAPELCDGKDNDCDGEIPSDEIDADEDGFLRCNDCNDQDSTIYPDAPGTHEGKDNNCNGAIDKDEKKCTFQSPLYPNYMPLVFPWLQSFQYSNLNYQLPLKVSWSQMQFPIYKQQFWYTGYQSSVYSNRYIQNIFQYGLLQFPFSQSNWEQSYIMPWVIVINQNL